MDILWYGLKVAVVGMLVVFVGLVILIGCIKALSAATSRGKETPQGGVPGDGAPKAAPAQPLPPVQASTPRTYVPGPRLTKQDDALYAVISATVAATLEAEGVNPEGGFVIRSINALNEPKPGPKLTPKDDAFYALVTAAIGRVLEAEGTNPEGGFAIRKIEAL